jgi:hypothetical protein
MDPILNELSFDHVDGLDVDKRLVMLARTVHALRQLGFSRALRTVRHYLELPITESTHLRTWLFGQGPLREERQLLKAALGRAPFVEDLLDQVAARSDQLIEIRHQDKAATGLSAAFLLHTVSVSLYGINSFEQAEIPVNVVSIDEDTAILETIQNVENVWNIDSVTAQRTAFTNKIRLSISSGSEAFARRDELFPKLDWSIEAAKSLKSLRGTEAVFQDIVSQLQQLSISVANWSGGPFEPQLRYSVESESTLADPRLGSLRDCTFEGETMRLSLHLKLMSGWRIYYQFEEIPTFSETPSSPSETRKGRALVGYIGPHLSTTSFG